MAKQVDSDNLLARELEGTEEEVTISLLDISINPNAERFYQRLLNTTSVIAGGLNGKLEGYNSNHADLEPMPCQIDHAKKVYSTWL